MPTYRIILRDVLVGITAISVMFFCMILYLDKYGYPARASRAQCQNNLRNLSLAVASYSVRCGAFPTSTTPGTNHSWTAQALMDMDQAGLFAAYNFSVANHHPANSTAVGTRLWLMTCPGSPSPMSSIPSERIRREDGSPYPRGTAFARGSYGGNWGGGRLPGFGDDFARTVGNYRGVLIPVGAAIPGGVTGPVRQSDVVDGLATTILLAEKRGGQGWAVGGYAGSEFDAATSPFIATPPDVRAVVAGSYHDEAVNVAFADGSVRALKPRIARPVWYALITRDGGEPIVRDDY